MSNFAWMIIIVLILTALGSLVLALVTIKFYWGDRGTPPPSGNTRHQQREEELRLRAKQIEESKQNPRTTRKSSFWDNSKKSFPD